MKVVNKTKWRTDQLKAILLKLADKMLDPEHRRRFVVTIKPSRKTYNWPMGTYTGNATVGGRNSTLYVPPDVFYDKPGFAKVAAHEFAHNVGAPGGRAGERDLRSSAAYGWRAGKYQTIYAWAESMPVEKKPVKAAPSRNEEAELRLLQLQDRLAAWRQKEKTAKTKIKKLSQTLRRLSKRLATRGEHDVDDARRVPRGNEEKEARQEEGTQAEAAISAPGKTGRADRPVAESEPPARTQPDAGRREPDGNPGSGGSSAAGSSG